MPLQDHFHPPLWPKRDWHSFHNAWATSIAASLNRVLPGGYFAEPNVQYGIEIDVGTYEDAAAAEPPGPPVWAPPAPQSTIDLPMVEDIVEIGIFHPAESTRLVAAIELVSPSNKDRPANREAFVSKCAALLQRGVGLLIVDVVTHRASNLHDKVIERLGGVIDLPRQAELYAASYHPASEEVGRHRLQIWFEPLALNQRLPTLPLYLMGGPCLRVDLEESYERTRHELRLGVNGA